ncbi:unnamed protein product, partial [Ectocarpus sp. 12 AP-2014]
VRHSSIIIDRGCACIEHDARADSIHCQKCFNLETHAVKAYSGSGVVLFAGDRVSRERQRVHRERAGQPSRESLLVPTSTQDLLIVSLQQGCASSGRISAARSTCRHVGQTLAQRILSHVVRRRTSVRPRCASHHPQ